MKKLILLCLVSCLFMTANVSARDDRIKVDLEPFLSSEKAKQALLDIPLYFAGQKHAKADKSWGEITTSRKTNAFNKSDQEACEWVMLSALIVLQESAVQRGMNAVVDIKSNYKHKEFASSTQFECGAGTILAGVALKGTLVSLPE